VRDGSGADVAAGGCWLPGNDLGAAVKMRADSRISVIAGPRPCGVTPPDVPVTSQDADRATAGRLRFIRGAGVAFQGEPARPRSRGTRAGASGRKGALRLMRWWHHFPPAGSRCRPQAQVRDWPGRIVRPDLTARAEQSVDAAGPGRQASATCPSARHPATAEAAGRPAPAATARDLRWPPDHPRPLHGTPRPGDRGRCLPRQAGRTVTRQAGRQPRRAGAPAGPDQAAGAGQRRNVPGGGCPD
jgi:hypothetical protein